MSEKVSNALASQQLHAHALANASNEVTAAATSCQLQPSSVTSSGTYKDPMQPLQFETDAPAAAISAQLNFKIVPVESMGHHGLGNSYQEMFASMNASQISNASTESSCSPPTAAAGAPPKPSRHMAVQPLNSVSK